MQSAGTATDSLLGTMSLNPNLVPQQVPAGTENDNIVDIWTPPLRHGVANSDEMSIVGAEHIPNDDPEAPINPEPDLFLADLTHLSDDEGGAQLDSLQAQFSAVHSRSDSRSKLDSARLSKEIQHFRHEKTRRKPPNERVAILQGALVTKQAQVIEAYKARKAADRYLMDLKVEVQSMP